MMRDYALVFYSGPIKEYFLNSTVCRPSVRLYIVIQPLLCPLSLLWK